MESWSKALKQYHAENPDEKYSIPKKGTPKYEAVLKLSGIVKKVAPVGVPVATPVEVEAPKVVKPRKPRAKKVPPVEDPHADV